MDSLYTAETLQYDEEMPSIHSAQHYQFIPSKTHDITMSRQPKQPKLVDSELLSEEETCSLTSWVLQGELAFLRQCRKIYFVRCYNIYIFPCADSFLADYCVRLTASLNSGKETRSDTSELDELSPLTYITDEETDILISQ
jgi:hypothetical protein